MATPFSDPARSPAPLLDPAPGPAPGRAGRIADRTAAVLLLLVATVVGLVAGTVLLFIGASAGECGGCDVDAQRSAATWGLGLGLLGWLVGGTLTVVRLIARRPAWPFALVTVLGVAGGLAVGYVGVAAAA